MRPSTSLCCLAALVAFALPSAQAADPNPIWSNPESARSENPDFALQGEYGSAAPGAPTGVQVVALGGGKFEAHLLDGGLWARTRNPNYLGELCIYLSFALLSLHWLPFVFFGSVIAVEWVPNMRRKDKSLSRYADFAAYASRSGLLFPKLF